MIPVSDSPRLHSIPWVTYALILINVGVWLYTLSLPATVEGTRIEARQEFREQTATVCYGFETTPTERDRFFCERSFQPREFLDVISGDPRYEVDETQVLLSIITSIFMHAGWLHIIGNMLFLWVFGDNVEDRLGKLRFFAFYLLAGLAALGAQIAADPDSGMPMVGASGAIAGVLGGYLRLFPHAQVLTLVPLGFFLTTFVWPAYAFLGIWIGMQLLNATLDSGAIGGGVAWFAHIGGFAVGWLAVSAFMPRRRARAARRFEADVD